MRRKNAVVDVCEEPEIQFEASDELLAAVQAWLLARGCEVKKEVSERATYYDTENLRLLREGMEYRVKGKGSQFRHDMKTPIDTQMRAVVPDQNDILWRNELKLQSKSAIPSLMTFFGEAILKPVQDRVYKFFDKELKPKFHSIFRKVKIDIECGEGPDAGRVEYSFQSGYMESIDGRRKSHPLKILELELRDGSMEALLAEKAEVLETFGPCGLRLLPERKVIIGMALNLPEMSAKQRHAFEDARERNHLQDRRTAAYSSNSALLSIAEAV